MDKNQSSTPQILHGILLHRVLALLMLALLIATVSSLVTYYFLNKQYQSQLQRYQQLAPKVVPTSTLSFSQILDQDITASNSKSSFQVDTTNWKTYSNQEFGLSFKYPSTYISEENNPKPGSPYHVFLFSSENLKKEFDDCRSDKSGSGECSYSFGITFNSKSKNTWHTYENTQTGHLYKQSQLGGYDTQETLYVGMGITYDAYVNRASDVLQIESNILGAVGENTQSEVDLFKQILTTIKFTQ